MIQNKRVLVYIPARSGSKSIIDKNIVDVCGKPLIAHSIEAAKQSKYVDKVIVSTDSSKYAEIARKYGAEVPYLRPAELATDLAREMDSCLHLLQWIDKKTTEKFDIIVKLEPTSPLRIVKDLDKAIEKLDAMDAETVVSVTEAMTHPYWMNTLPSNASMKGFLSEEAKHKNRQELPVFYQIDGVVYAATVSFVKEHKSWFSDEKGYATITPNNRAIDIDGPVQLELVRLLLKKRMEENHASYN